MNKMSKEQIFETIKANIKLILPYLDIETIKIEDSLKDLGANSLDRAELTIKTMETLKLKIPLVEFGGVKNIEGLVEVFYEKVNAQ